MSVTISLSSSSLHTYNLCPRRYFLEYYVKMEGEENIFGTLGTAIHTVAQLLVENFFTPNNNPDDKKIIREMRNIATERWSDIFQATFEEIPDERKPEVNSFSWIINQGYPIINNMITMMQQEQIFCSEPILVEEKFKLPLLSDKLQLTGIVDLMFLTEDGCRIIDWKSQHKLPDTEESTEQGDWQLELYSLYAMHVLKKLRGETNQNKVTAERWFVRHKVIHTYEIGTDDIKESVKQLLKTRNRILSGDFKPVKGEGCKYCPLKWKDCKEIPYDE